MQAVRMARGERRELRLGLVERILGNQLVLYGSARAAGVRLADAAQQVDGVHLAAVRGLQPVLECSGDR